MKTLTMAEAGSDMEAVLKAAQKERIVLLRGNKPSAVLVGVESYDEEDLRLATSAEFWKMIEARRKDRTIPLAELKSRLKTAGKKARSPTRQSSRATKRGRQAK